MQGASRCRADQAPRHLISFLHAYYQGYDKAEASIFSIAVVKIASLASVKADKQRMIAYRRISPRSAGPPTKCISSTLCIRVFWPQSFMPPQDCSDCIAVIKHLVLKSAKMQSNSYDDMASIKSTSRHYSFQAHMYANITHAFLTTRSVLQDW